MGQEFPIKSDSVGGEAAKYQQIFDSIVQDNSPFFYFCLCVVRSWEVSIFKETNSSLWSIYVSQNFLFG